MRAKLPVRPEWLIEDRDSRGIFIPITLPIEMPDAFVCNCDEVAFNVVELLKRRGYRVPQDVAVTGYDDFRYSTHLQPAPDHPPGGRGRDGPHRRGTTVPQNVP